jgi:hypothetical protein
MLLDPDPGQPNHADPDPQHCFNQYIRCLSLVKNHLVTSSSMVLAFDAIMDHVIVCRIVNHCYVAVFSEHFSVPCIVVVCVSC